MSTPMQRVCVTSLLVAAVCAIQPAPTDAAESYERAPVMRASKLLDAAKVKTANYTVRERVTTSGYFLNFEMETNYGLMPAGSRALLDIRIRETETLASAAGRNATSAFAKAVEGTLRQTPTGAMKLVKDPSGSVKQMSKGVFRTFGNVTHAMDSRPKSKYEGGTIAGDLYGSQKRKIAVSLKLDPYSSSPKVQQFLEELAKGQALGEFAAGQATGNLPGGGGYIASAAQYREDVVASIQNMSASELYRANQETLTVAGIHPYVARKFLSNANLSPTHQTVIAKALKGLDGVKNPGALLEAAAESTDEVLALMHAQQTLMYAQYHKNKERFRLLEAIGGIVGGITESGKMIVVAPFDILYWNREADVGSRALLKLARKHGASSMQLRTTGRITKRASDEIRRRGFGIAWGLPLPREEAQSGG